MCCHNTNLSLTSIVFSFGRVSGVEIVTFYYEDPGGALPGWLVNWATTTMMVIALVSLNGCLDDSCDLP